MLTTQTLGTLPSEYLNKDGNFTEKSANRNLDHLAWGNGVYKCIRTMAVNKKNKSGQVDLKGSH